MKVLCVLCDVIEDIADNSFQAKRLRNQQGRMYMCSTCDNRIQDNTKKRIASGKFDMYRIKQKDDHILIK